MRKSLAILCLSSLLVIPACQGTGDPDSAITTATLFREMTDLHFLTSFPDPPFRTVQFSSYDHRSRMPGGPDWFANSDGFGGEPIPNFEQVLSEPNEDGIGEYLIADVEGPGAIVRLWSAAISGEIRLYLDGEPDPVFDGPAIDFFHRTLDGYPEIEGLDRKQLEKTVYQRDASYAPIPFGRRMRLEWTGDLEAIHFYQVQVRLYAAGTKIRTFSPPDLAVYAETIDEVTQALADPDERLEVRSREDAQAIVAVLEPGTSQEVISLEGPKALEGLSLKLEAQDLDRALRQTLLHIHFDGHPWGQVQSPIGDFFGAAPGINPYRSLPFSVFPDGTMVCRFVMPFASSMSIRLENRGTQVVSVRGEVLPLPFEWDEGSSLHFRARWRTDHELIASNRDVQDLPFLLAHGRGLYVGTTSILLNPNQVPTPYGNWWGEGDEKVFVDDEARPSIFGTGSEDYYNYSWSSPDIFFFPYCGQPRNDGPGNRGFVSNYRWHILDPIPFTRNIRFFMELYSHERTPGLSYARIAYHYARPGITDDHQAIMPEDLRPLELPDGWQPAARMGARNSVIHPAEDLVNERRNTESRRGRLWAGGKILTWKPRVPGETKAFELPIEDNGTYRIHIAAALTPESGRFAMRLDGEAITLRGQQEHVDLFRPFRILLRNFALQDRELAQGRHTLMLEYLGAPPGIERAEIGIDFIWIQKIEP
ncbi:MAG: glycoside hydrolase family 172 protein [Candidatus Aminicenantaceae bacterium]